MMNSDSTGIRDPRPLRRRTSISSPRVAPFTPFTPSLTYRSPIIRSPLAPTLYQTSFLTNEQLSNRDTPEYRPVPPPHTWNRRVSVSHPQSRSRKLAASFGCLVLTVLCWHSLNVHSRLKPPIRPQSSKNLFHNDALPYYHPYLIPKTNNIDSTFVSEDSDVLPPRISRQLLPPGPAYNSASLPSLSLVLPCPQHNLTTVLPRTLYSLRTRLVSASPPQPIVLVCSPSQSREAIRIAENYKQQEIYVRVTSFEPLPGQNEQRRQSNLDINVIHVAASLPTEWALILDGEGLVNFPLSVITLLHHPPQSMALPFGPRGAVFSSSKASCVSNRFPGAAPVAVAFLMPPFVCPTHLLREAEAGLDMRPGLSPWSALGLRIALGATQRDQSIFSSSSGAVVGGFVVGIDFPSKPEMWCSPVSGGNPPGSLEREHGPSHLAGTAPQSAESDHVSAYIHSVLHDAHRGFSASGTIVVLLPYMSDLSAFLPTLCRSARLGHNLHVLIYGKQPTQLTDALNDCHMHYDSLSPGSNREALWDWLTEFAVASDVIVAVSRDRVAKIELELAIQNLDELRPPPLSENVVIWLPPNELPFLEWAGALSIDEWRRKKKPSSFTRSTSKFGIPDRLARPEGRPSSNHQRSPSIPCSTSSLCTIRSLLW